MHHHQSLLLPLLPSIVPVALLLLICSLRASADTKPSPVPAATALPVVVAALAAPCNAATPRDTNNEVVSTL